MSEAKDDQYSPEETAQRMDRILKRVLTTPHKIQRPLKQKKRGRPRKQKLTPRR
jgi:hypothetical protein